jgi:hypothetical protein
LLRELLEAIQAGSYDDFVAKGSAGFKAGANADRFRMASTEVGARLSNGYHASLLGSLRRGEAMIWLFRLEFADQGDDALVFLTMDRWQVAGFHVDVPPKSGKEK